jgi:tetratricopeptide (TPR) repeat protein
VRLLTRSALLTLCATALAAVLTLLATAGLGGAPGDPRATSRLPGAAPVVHGPGAATGRTDLIAPLQSRLEALPRDHRGWSTLALAYVEQARVSADPSFYRKAGQALRRAAALAPADPVVLTARAALAAARHRFGEALDAATAAVAANPYLAEAHTLRSDALTELGRYRAARRAAHRADDLDPGPATFARLSYAAELRGRLAGATRLMRLARDAADPGAPSYAFASFHLGELARAAGNRGAAARHFAGALAADPGYLPARAGQARLAVAAGDLASAERAYREVVARLPVTEYVVELAELYLATGRARLAREQLAVAAAGNMLAAANGVRTDLETALFEADHGSPARALAAARAEWAARRSVHAADALGWALHAAGRDAQALRYVRAATRLGTLDPRLLFHRGAVEAALGRDGDAREHLRRAIELDGGAAPLRERQASELLAGLGGAR